MRSAFENPAWASPRSSSAGESSMSATGYEDDDATKRVRVVGFPESPNFKLEPHELSRFTSCSLDERPKRQSSLAQQLALEAFEQERKPKLRAINTKSKTLNIRTTRRASTPPAGLGASTTDHSHNNITVQNGPDSANDNRISFEFPSTLPSAAHYTHLNLHRAGISAGSEAMAIPQGLTKAYTAPQPLPELSELSPSLVSIIEGSNNSGIAAGNPTKTTTPTRRSGGGGKTDTTNSAAARLLPSPASNPHSPPGHSSSSSSVAAAAAAAAAVPYTFSPHIAAERGAQAQVAGLREALRQQQEEVARLQLELAKLAMQQQSSRQRSSSSDVHMTPATPDAPDEHHQGSGGGGGRGRGDHHRHNHHERTSMSLDECMESPFEGVAATQPSTAAQQQWNGEHYC